MNTADLRSIIDRRDARDYPILASVAGILLEQVAWHDERSAHLRAKASPDIIGAAEVQAHVLFARRIRETLSLVPHPGAGVVPPCIEERDRRLSDLRSTLSCLAGADPWLCCAFVARRAGLAVRRESLKDRGVLLTFASVVVRSTALEVSLGASSHDSAIRDAHRDVLALTGSAAWVALSICYAVQAAALCETLSFLAEPGSGSISSRAGSEVRARSVEEASWSSVVASSERAGASPILDGSAPGGEHGEIELETGRLKLGIRHMVDAMCRMNPYRDRTPWREALLWILRG